MEGSNRTPGWVEPLAIPVYLPNLDGVRKILPLWLKAHQVSWDGLVQSKVPAPDEWIPLANGLISKRQEIIELIHASLKCNEFNLWQRKFDIQYNQEQRFANEQMAWDFVSGFLERHPLPVNLKDLGPYRLRVIPVQSPGGSSNRESDCHIQWLTRSTGLRREVMVELIAEAFVCHDPDLEDHNRLLLPIPFRKTVEAEPAEIGDLRVWVASIQLVDTAGLAVLLARPGVDLAAPGIAHMWAAGSLVEVMLPVPAMRVDMTWSQTLRIVTAAAKNGRLFQTHRGEIGTSDLSAWD